MAVKTVGLPTTLQLYYVFSDNSYFATFGGYVLTAVCLFV